MEKAWKEIPGFSEYEVSTSGEVRKRTSSGFKPIGGKAKLNKYPAVFIRNDQGIWKGKTKHCLVLEAFVGPRPLGWVARHLDDDKENNLLSNLAWGTQGENEADKKRNGNSLLGETHHQAKLDAEKALYILKELKKGRTGTDLARELSLDHKSIYNVRNGVTWSHVTGIPRKKADKRLTQEDVEKIIEGLHAGRTYMSLAIEFGVDKTSIGNIKTGKTWARLPRPW